MPTHEPSSLTTLPTPNDNYFPTSVTIGDLHGNTLKFIHFLIKEGIIGFKSTNAEDHHQAYQELFQCYADAEQFFTNQKGNVIVGLDGNPLQISRDPVGRIDLYDTDYYGMKTAIDRYKTGEIHVKLSEKIRAFESSPENIRKYRAIDDRFNAFLKKIEVKNKNTLVRCVGDGFGDRGVNDRWTLEMLDFIQNQGVRTTTITSNHDLEFISYYESKTSTTPINFHIGPSQRTSLSALEFLENSKILSSRELTQLINKAYKPTLKLIDYTFTDTGIRLFTHAPITFDAIQHVARRLGVRYRDNTQENLAKTIDKINDKIKEHASNNTIHKLWINDKDGGYSGQHNVSCADLPFMHFLWNRLEHGREDDLSLRPCAHNNYTIDYVHGHDDTPSALEHVTNLDGPQGKFNTPEYNVKEYKVLALNEGSTIKTSAARAGVVTALTAAGISAGVLAAVFVPLLLLTVFAPPLGLGLLAFGLALGGLALAIGFAAGIYKGWKTEKAQTQSNSRSILTPAVHEEANDTGYANSTSLVLARMGVKPTGVDLALPNPPQSAEPTQNKEDIIMVGTGADAQNGVDSESSVVTTMRNIKS